MKKILFLCLFILLAFANTYATDYPTKVINGKNYYVYTVEAGDGLYAIGRKFNVTQAELHDANPGLVAEIQVGDTIYVPVKERIVSNTTPSTDHVIKHTVLPKQTLYAISKIYGVGIESIKALNPGCEEGVKIGDVLKIPVVKTNNNTNEKSSYERTTTPKRTKQHVVKNGESLYKICKMYDVDINDVFTCNPGLTDRLKDGQIILIPMGDGTITSSATQARVTANQKSTAIQARADGEYVLYTVKSGETITSIAKKFDITAKELLNINPAYKQRNLNVGDKIMLPKNAKTRQTTEASKEVNSKLSSITSGTGRMAYAQENSSEPAPLAMKSSVAAYNEELPAWSSCAPISDELNIAVLLPMMTNHYDADNNSERFVSFYRGMLIALNDLKQQGISVRVQTYDIAKDTATLAAVLREPALRQADLIIGPAYKNQVPMVSLFAKKHKIYTIVPFTPHIAQNDLHEYIFKFNPSWDELYAVVAENIIKKSDKQKFALLTFGNNNQKGTCLCKALETALKKRNMTYDKINIDSNNADSINTKLGSGRRNLVLCTNDRVYARLVTDKLDESHRMSCTLWGFEDCSTLFKGMNNGYYFTIFTPQPTNAYAEKYSEWFGDRPTSELPHYDLLGYDVMMYFGNAAKKIDGKITIMEPNIQSKMMQSHFYFVKDNYRKNYLNINHCFVHWNGYNFSAPICFR